MAGTGEIYRDSDGEWGFRVKATGGKAVATDGGSTYSAKDEAKMTLQKLMRGDYDGPISEVPTLTCGQEITQDTTLEGDLACAIGPALVVVTDGVTLDLGGFTVSGDADSSGGGPGILLSKVSGVTIRKGTVQHFGAGIVIAGGGGNVVQNVTVQDNIGSVGGDFGDGIVIDSSSENRIEGNTVRRNGPFSGISMLGMSQHNQVLNNVVTDNNMSHVGDPSAGRQVMGVRIEGPEANDNAVDGNTVTGSGADGIVVLPTCDPSSVPECAGSPPNERNEITNNLSHRNGTSGFGSGIRLFTVANPVAPAHTTIRENVAEENTTHGIAIDAVGNNNPGPTENQIIGNRAQRNGAYDGFDGNLNPQCGSNHWEGNDFGTVNQPCVSGPVPPPPVPPPAP
ncbi:MAG: right-handed parallel beta-helix repeat-containing protein [Acidimicrobiales bacterium]